MDLYNNFNYIFNDKILLDNALTHSSYANEMHISKSSNNERLEFLGDAVLELIISEILYREKKDVTEGELSKLRASIVCEKSLAYCAKKLDIGKYLLLGKGEEATGGRERDSILADALEAIIGAIYLDGGFTNVKEFIYKNIYENIANNKLFFDSKTILQELIQTNSKDLIIYELISEEGPDHKKTFNVAVKVNNIELGRGRGSSKKNAEQDAAYKAIQKLQKKK